MLTLALTYYVGVVAAVCAVCGLPASRSAAAAAGLVVCSRLAADARRHAILVDISTQH